MARLNELNKNLMSVLLRLVSSQELCKYLLYDSIDPLSEADIENTASLIFTKIFPMPKAITSKIKEEVCFISVIFDDIKLSTNSGFKDTVLSISVYCHVDKWRLDGSLEDSLRPYAIMHQIDKLINETRLIGLGKMQFLRAVPIAANEFYMGYKISYYVVDFN